ncbi:DUF6293 family protein [Haladaptatus sp. F3-133]|jgi:hypothetical protein|uniref:DUF6293 family protein n=1 Tax=Halorutilus salinus TaxID=2487751 RepID=A0A9Q4C6A2_9EURY|nr:DUF6293 family protein [Halorutilus salinus]MCX2819955.1 DUF6293 family protein [Halorutilus salinus]
MKTHVVPVGFDYDRLIAPLVRDKVDVDRAVLLEGSRGSSDVARKLREEFASLFDAETTTVKVDDVYDYDGVFATAYGVLRDERDDGNEVRVNVSAMPRPVSFAFTNAAQHVVVEDEEARGSILAYYTAPERYLETELAEEVDELVRLMRRLKDEGLTDAAERELDERYSRANELLREFEERGTTVGAREFNGSHVIEMPITPPAELKGFERTLLRVLADTGVVDSVSELADVVAEHTGRENTDSLRSKVIYDVRSLHEKGYVEQTESGRSHETRLSHLGRLWVRAHDGSTNDEGGGTL